MGWRKWSVSPLLGPGQQGHYSSHREAFTLKHSEGNIWENHMTNRVLFNLLYFYCLLLIASFLKPRGNRQRHFVLDSRVSDVSFSIFNKLQTQKLQQCWLSGNIKNYHDVCTCAWGRIYEQQIFTFSYPHWALLTLGWAEERRGREGRRDSVYSGVGYSMTDHQHQRAIHHCQPGEATGTRQREAARRELGWRTINSRENKGHSCPHEKEQMCLKHLWERSTRVRLCGGLC